MFTRLCSQSCKMLPQTCLLVVACAWLSLRRHGMCDAYELRAGLSTKTGYIRASVVGPVWLYGLLHVLTLLMLGVCSSTLFSTSNTNAASVLRSSDQLHEVVTLACELLPPMPDASTVIMANLPPAPQIPHGELSQVPHLQAAAHVYVPMSIVFT